MIVEAFRRFKTKHEHMLASKETRSTEWVQVQQLFPLSNGLPHSKTKQIGFFSIEKAVNEEEIEFLAVHTRVTYPGSQMMIPCSSCQALEQPVLC